MTGGRGHTPGFARLYRTTPKDWPNTVSMEEIPPKHRRLQDHTAERKAGETYAPHAPAEHQLADAVGRLAAAVESLTEAVRPRINTWREP